MKESYATKSNPQIVHSSAVYYHLNVVQKSSKQLLTIKCKKKINA